MCRADVTGGRHNILKSTCVKINNKKEKAVGWKDHVTCYDLGQGNILSSSLNQTWWVHRFFSFLTSDGGSAKFPGLIVRWGYKNCSIEPCREVSLLHIQSTKWMSGFPSFSSEASHAATLTKAGETCDSAVTSNPFNASTGNWTAFFATTKEKCFFFIVIFLFFLHAFSFWVRNPKNVLRPACKNDCSPWAQLCPRADNCNLKLHRSVWGRNQMTEIISHFFRGLCDLTGHERGSTMRTEEVALTRPSWAFWKPACVQPWNCCFSQITRPNK